MTGFLGNHPVRVVAQLVIFSLLVGCALTWLGVTPDWLVGRAFQLVGELWAATVSGFGKFGGTIALGAMVVVPVFLFSRLVGARR